MLTIWLFLKNNKDSKKIQEKKRKEIQIHKSTYKETLLLKEKKFADLLEH